MNYFCNLCHKTIKHTSKIKHFNTENHISSESSFISRYIILNSDFNKVDEKLRKYVNI